MAGGLHMRTGHTFVGPRGGWAGEWAASLLLATSIAAALAGCAGSPESRTAADKPAKSSPAADKRIEDLCKFIDESDPIAQLDLGGRDKPRAMYPAPGEAAFDPLDYDA